MIVVWEQAPLNTGNNNQLSAYLHNSFWHPMDTLRDRQKLEELWAGQSPLEGVELIPKPIMGTDFGSAKESC